MDQTLMDDITNMWLFKHKDMYFETKYTSPEVIDQIEYMGTRESDVFLVTYPKSGTIWTQQILCLIYKERYENIKGDANNMTNVPWIEYNYYNTDFESRSSPRLFSSHLPYYLMPRSLRNRKGKVIYVYRNAKDNVVSFYHFTNVAVEIKQLNLTWEKFFELYMAGKVIGGFWSDHIRGWYTHKEEFNCLFISYEEMIKDLRSAVLKICEFVNIKLDDEAINRIVDKSTFKKMKQDPLANYTFLPEDVLDQSKTEFIRKGIIGDWKNTLTVAQNERMDKMLQEKMSDIPIKFIWDMN